MADKHWPRICHSRRATSRRLHTWIASSFSSYLTRLISALAKVEAMFPRIKPKRSFPKIITKLARAPCKNKMIESYTLQCNFERQFTESNGYEVVFHLRKIKERKRNGLGHTSISFLLGASFHFFAYRIFLLHFLAVDICVVKCFQYRVSPVKNR